MKSASALSIVETSKSMKYEAKEGHIMYAIVHHRVMDREKFLATDPQDIAGNAPPGVQVRQFIPARDASAADCLWETESLEALRDYLDPVTRGFCQNTYFEVDSESAFGLPQPVGSATVGNSPTIT